MGDNRIKKGLNWLLANADYQGDECLIWPFYRNPNGYGQFGHLGKMCWAHRYMCELINGPAPSHKHESAHSCANGHGGCVHPKHLSWKTRSGNLLDCTEHGTHPRNVYGLNGRLSQEQVQEIRELKGKKTQAEIAVMFGVHGPTIRDIFSGRTYAKERKIKLYTPEENDLLREAIRRNYDYDQMAAFVGRSVNSVRQKAYRMTAANSALPAR